MKYPKPGTQPDKILRVLLDADGAWVSKRMFVQEMFLSQSGARIFELENKYHWPIEHSDFTDDYKFKSYRIIQKPRTEELFTNQC